MVTMKDVAIEAKVSIATVSNYLNNTKPVSPYKLAKIAEAIEKLNYIPNLYARNLKSGVNNDIGVILPNFADPYYVQIFQGIERYYSKMDYFVNVSLSNEIPDVEMNIIVNFLKKKTAGVIMVTCQPDNFNFFYRYFHKDNVPPLVSIDRRIKGLDTNFISFDNSSTICSLTQQLFAKGCKKVAILAGSKSFSCEEDCVAGYIQAHNLAEIPVAQDYIFRSVLTKESAFRTTSMFLKSHKPDAIICTSASGAYGVISSLSLIGYSVPEDIIVAMLGEDNWDKSTSSSSFISTARPAIILGKEAAEMLQNQIHMSLTCESQNVILKDRFLSCYPQTLKPKVVSSKCPQYNETLNVLMLDALQVNSFMGLLPNFENTWQIKANIKTMPHQHMLDTIIENHKSKSSEYDIYMFDIPWLYYLAGEGIISDISSYLNDKSFNKEIYLPGCLKYYSDVNGKYYGLPFTYAPQILYYRKDIFQDPKIRNQYKKKYNINLHPPRTWTEFNVICSFFTRSVNPLSPTEFGTSLPTAYPECLAPEIYMRLWSYGSRVYDDNFNIVFDSPATLKAYVSLLKTFKVASNNHMKHDDITVVNDFISGKSAMLITYPPFLTDIIDLQKSSIIGNIGYDHIPGKHPILGGWSLGVSSQSKQKDAAFKFIDWACGDGIANYFTLLDGNSAITHVFENDELISLYPWLPLYHDVYKYVQPIDLPFAKGKKIVPQNEIDNVLCDWLYKALDNTIPITDAIKNTHNDLVKLFHSYGY